MTAEPLEAWVEARVLENVSPELWRRLRSTRTRRAPTDFAAAEADLVMLARRFGAGNCSRSSGTPLAQSCSSESPQPRLHTGSSAPTCPT
jgi:hypothetical protein